MEPERPGAALERGGLTPLWNGTAALTGALWRVAAPIESAIKPVKPAHSIAAYAASLVALLLALVTRGAFAQNFTVDWFTTAGGGGTSRGGVYEVSGTIGQWDAGLIIDGNWTLVGGFWGLIPTDTPPSQPRMSIMRLNGNVTISWNPAIGRLQQADNLTGPWINVTDASSPYNVSTSAARKFYRVKQ
jgi:hypothetical protein